MNWNLLSGIYGSVAGARNALYDRGWLRSRSLQGSVISVGNLSAGGSGKTPFVILLGELLKARGIGFDVLSRGYGRRTHGVLLVDPGGLPQDFGDEPLLIARRLQVPVVVGEDRSEAGHFAEARFGVQVHLLDDGFQHRQLARDIDIVLVNSKDLGDRLLPAGNLRESLPARRRATVLAVPVEDDAAVAWLRGLGLTQAVWRFRREMVVPEVAGSVVAFCGIARPEQFFLGIVATGVTIAARRVFRDHHRFRAADLLEVERMADRSGARAVLTTEKDRVRIGDLAVHLGPAPLLTVGLNISFDDPVAVAKTVLARLH